jgi:hypothetical protein
MKSLIIVLALLASACGGKQTSSTADDLPPLPRLSHTPVAQLLEASEKIGLNSAQVTRLEEIDADLLAANAALEGELGGASAERAAELRAQIDRNNRAAIYRAFGHFDFPQRDRAIDQLRDHGHDVEALFPDREPAAGQ